MASNGTSIALAGTYNGQSFEIGEVPSRTLPLEGPNFGFEAFVALLDGNGVATWAAPVALGIGYQPRTAYAVAFAGNDVVVAGSHASSDGGDADRDVFIRKFTPEPNNGIAEKASFQFGGDGSDEAVAVAAAATGEFYVTGTITASAGKTVTCGMTTHTPKNGMFVAGYDSLGKCQWFVQAEGHVQPTALNYDENTRLRVVGHFDGTLMLPDGSTFSADAGATDSFILTLEMSTGLLMTKTQLEAGPGGAVRAVAATIGSDGTLYIAGQLEGKTSVEPNHVEDGQLAAFVMPVGLEAAWKQVFPGGQAKELGQATGTSLALAADGSLYVGGTFRDLIDIDPASPSGTFERAGVNPFLARLDPTTGTVRWFDVYNGKGQVQSTESFYVTALKTDVVLAGNWIPDFNFSEDESKTLVAKGSGIVDEDIIAAKLTLEP
ncbi:hypothetical protein [Polyangium jinanense]|uniref:Cell surface protein n=1 Tax=Polyangium jinanense TaxID=2829994 RepID=A0A9X4AUT9_9BACT|nr:hypothetical protein [Polyangium jinanense]MDC3958034.1 hypothetical protein [Polyangium jinanense]MDC3983587.1 hypothetical protein [Polyangium jinanense]